MDKKIIILIGIIIIGLIYFFFIKKENFEYNNERYIVLEFFPVNPTDDGGFYWWVHNVACLFKLCELNNKKPMIMLNGGYYYDKTRKEESWWDYFFDYPNTTPFEYKLFKNNKDLEPVRDLKLDKDKSYKYDMSTFQSVVRPATYDIGDYYKNVKLKPYLNEKINDIYRKGNPYNKFQIGIHYRGTDKFYGNGDQEDLMKNKHVEYSVVNENMLKYLNDNNINDYVLYVASDEKPFIDYIKTQHPTAYTYEECFRTETSTSGVELDDTSMCNAYTENDPECKDWKKYNQISIHKGYQDISPFKKGEDAIIDVWLLSKSDLYFTTHGGNFATHPKRINKNIKEIKII